jgi:pimeloyl-ACP methyl ester carboxylesterase
MITLLLGLVWLLSTTLVETTHTLADGDGSPPNNISPSTTPVPVSEHYVLFLNGINSFATSEEPLDGKFDVIQQELADELNIERFVYFSYSAARYHEEGGFYCQGWGAGGGLVTGGCETYIGTEHVVPSDNLAVLSAWPEYEESDTHLSLHLQAEALDWLVGQIVSRDPNSRIHLVGYSLGGIVASHWAAHQGQSPTWRQHVSSIVIIESPVGGIPLAGPLSDGCGLEPSCYLLRFVADHEWGRTVFTQLQMPTDSEESIIGSLEDAARTYPLTSIQSTTDYTVNGEGLPFCYVEIKCADDDIQWVPIGFGTQLWSGKSHTLHFDENLGGDELATEPFRYWAVEWRTLVRENHSAPLIHSQTASWVAEAIEKAATEREVLDSAITGSSGFFVLHPGESADIVFDIQNTGNVSWLPAEGYALINTNEQSLGASPVQRLTSEIPPGEIAQWTIPVTAPAQIGLNWTEWQMAHDGEPFGAKASSLVAVVPEGEIDIDIAALLEQWLDELKKEIEDEINQFLEELADRFEEWLQRESERLLSELLESLSQQCCGAAIIAPGALLLVVWTSGRRRRKRVRDRDRE